MTTYQNYMLKPKENDKQICILETYSKSNNYIFNIAPLKTLLFKNYTCLNFFFKLTCQIPIGIFYEKIFLKIKCKWRTKTCFIQVLWLVLVIIEANSWLWFWSHFGFCFSRNPSFGLATKAKGVTRLQAKRKPESQGKEVPRVRAKKKPGSHITYSQECKKVWGSMREWTLTL